MRPSVVQRAVFRYDSAPLADTAATYVYSTRNSNPAQKCQRHVSSGRNRVPTPFPDMLLTLRQTSSQPALSKVEGFTKLAPELPTQMPWADPPTNEFLDAIPVEYGAASSISIFVD